MFQPSTQKYRNVRPKIDHPAKEQPRGKAAAPYMQEGTMLGRSKTFLIEKLIAGGGFGQIYRAVDVDRNEILAVKVERERPPESARMVLEARVLGELQGVAHFPKIYYIGHYGDCNYIVMQMLGRNLTDIRKALPAKRFTVHSTIRVGIQMVTALKSLHDNGYLHRDMKPTNMCAGIDSHRRQIYLVDFGMVRNFKADDGSTRQPRAYAGFRGTQRYASINVHDRFDQGPVDDLWSLYYSLIELAEGNLPWKMFETPDEVAQIKKNLRFEDLSRNLPVHFSKFERSLRRVPHMGHPNYSGLIGYLENCCRFVDTNAEFEWDDDS
ncbi:unnamed protein product [Caenorhabditis auriculariae]|uniref:Protein kinase domain-containing protein n=1 Tax=Caenorhabditis auriculariae TaxID=2777116 RepID=A0A8S1H4G4_9PELO|nr:unnamed protein product [Caenorhabditis auriculariae]